MGMYKVKDLEKSENENVSSLPPRAIYGRAVKGRKSQISFPSFIPAMFRQPKGIDSGGILEELGPLPY